MYFVCTSQFYALSRSTIKSLDICYKLFNVLHQKYKCVREEEIICLKYTWFLPTSLSLCLQFIPVKYLNFPFNNLLNVWKSVIINFNLKIVESSYSDMYIRSGILQGNHGNLVSPSVGGVGK